MDIQQFEGRKKDHIRHALNPAHQATGMSGLDRIHLYHEALPDLDFEEVRIESVCLGKALRTPFYIAGMTAGHADALTLNRALALACQERGWAMGVGSQRREIESHSELDQWRRLRDEVPELVLFANIGVSQVVKTPVSRIAGLIEEIGAQALVVHTNPLQEALQPEGTPQFKNALVALKDLCGELSVPVVLKETGCGFSKETLKRVGGIGLAAVDISGLGGTHWGRIEGARADRLSIQASAAETFSNWGESTVNSVMAAREILQEVGQGVGKGLEIWASGGVRTGLDAAKLIALGAHRVGYARPALEAVLEGPDALRKWMEIQEYELKVALFCTGCATPAALREKEGSFC